MQVAPNELADLLALRTQREPNAGSATASKESRRSKWAQQMELAVRKTTEANLSDQLVRVELRNDAAQTEQRRDVSEAERARTATMREERRESAPLEGLVHDRRQDALVVVGAELPAQADKSSARRLSWFMNRRRWQNARARIEAALT